MTGDAKYLDDAANQVLMFKKYLYMPEYKIMSHVYDFHVEAATQVPWEEAMDGRVAFHIGAVGISASGP